MRKAPQVQSRPGKKFGKNKATGELGVNFVRDVVFREGSIFREYSQQLDVGLDGHIEFVDNEIATGILVGVQVKSGASYLRKRSDGSEFFYAASNDDIRYWGRQRIPVSLIFYDPESELSGWLDVTGFIRSKPEVLEQPHVVLCANAVSHPFDQAIFHTRFKATFRSYGAEAGIAEYADAATSLDPDERFAGLTSLLRNSSSRFSRLTCYLLANHLFDGDNRVRIAASDALSRYLPHPEVGFSPPEQIRHYVEVTLQTYGKSHIIQLLETAWLDVENLMQRGSLGQSVGVLILHVPGYEQALCEIIEDPLQGEGVRLAAMALAAEFGISSIIEYVGRRLDRIDWRGHQSLGLQEAAAWLAQMAAALLDAEGDLQRLISAEDYDDNALADLLQRASLCYLVEHETEIDQLWVCTRNPSVRFEAHVALNRAMGWRDPPEQYMESLFPVPAPQ